jgi:TolA-binding protein
VLSRRTGNRDDDPSTMSRDLAAGALEEEGNLAFEKAARAYERVIARFDRQRPIAANAIFRLAECYRKLGRFEEANVQYARILREFPDENELVERSRKFLAPRRR